MATNVPVRSQQNLWRAVPESDHFVGQSSRVLERSCEAEVCEFQLIVISDQNVGAFDIPLNEVPFMYITHGLQKLSHE
jgi:hypothetical protein